MRGRVVLRLSVLGWCLLVVGACGGSPGPTSTPTPDLPTVTSAPSTLTPSPEATFAPFPPPLPDDPADADHDLYVIYKWMEDRKPHYDQVLNGILVGPTVVPDWCPPGVKATHLPVEAVTGTLLDIKPAYLPEDTRESESEAKAFACEGNPVYLERHFGQPGNAVRYGGFIRIHRTLTGEPAVEVERPAERMKPGEIAGLPAVIVEPMLPEPYQHWTNVTVIVWDATTGVLTAVETSGFTLGETIRIAEGLFPSS